MTGKTNAASTGVDTSDATAATGDIVSGKTAYAKGAKVVGSLVLTGQIPYGIARPVSSDISYISRGGNYVNHGFTIQAINTSILGGKDIIFVSCTKSSGALPTPILIAKDGTVENGYLFQDMGLCMVQRLSGSLLQFVGDYMDYSF